MAEEIGRLWESSTEKDTIRGMGPQVDTTALYAEPGRFSRQRDGGGVFSLDLNHT